MKRILCHVAIVLALLTRTHGQSSPMNGIDPLVDSPEWIKWRLQVAPNVREIIDSTLRDCQTTRDEIRTILQRANQFRSKDAADEIRLVRSFDAKIDRTVQSVLEGGQLEQFRCWKSEFEYERLRKYCESMRLQEPLPDLAAVLRAVNGDVSTAVRMQSGNPLAELESAVDAFWNVHIQDLRSGNDQTASRRELEVVKEQVIDVLPKIATITHADLESLESVILCQKYPAFCEEMPADAAYAAAMSLAQGEAVGRLQRLYDEYRIKRKSLRAFLAQAQQQWDQADIRRRREVEVQKRMDAHQYPYMPWEKHPGKQFIQDLFVLECETIQSIRLTMNDDVLKRAPLDLQLALTPIVNK